MSGQSIEALAAACDAAAVELELRRGDLARARHARILATSVEMRAAAALDRALAARVGAIRAYGAAAAALNTAPLELAGLEEAGG